MFLKHCIDLFARNMNLSLTALGFLHMYGEVLKIFRDAMI